LESILEPVSTLFALLSGVSPPKRIDLEPLLVGVTATLLRTNFSVYVRGGLFSLELPYGDLVLTGELYALLEGVLTPGLG
jgi:hypothetical protein